MQADEPPLQRGDRVLVVYDPSGWAHPMREVDFVDHAGTWVGTLIFGFVAAVLAVLACRKVPAERPRPA
ncbi:hypothetical protein AB0J72_32630 [Dactylosporangium sp. NPDC049742]|uniref:hypothetical protein n=1 Tax=Dactylosporangium sp. NPDC049742 TaxID=3154737 RepID=UPI00342A51B2